MNPHTLSASAQRALDDARAQAVRLEHDAIGAEHIVLALIAPDGPGAPALRKLGLDVARVRQRLESGGRRGQGRGGAEDLAYTSHAKHLIEAASKEARESGTGLSAEHLLIAALVEPRGTMSKLLAEAGVTAERLLDPCDGRTRPLELRSPKPAMQRGFRGGITGCLGGVAGRRRPSRSPYVQPLTNPQTFGKLSGSRGLRLAAPRGSGQVPGHAGESIRTPTLSPLDPGSEPR